MASRNPLTSDETLAKAADRIEKLQSKIGSHIKSLREDQQLSEEIKEVGMNRLESAGQAAAELGSALLEARHRIFQSEQSPDDSSPTMTESPSSNPPLANSVDAAGPADDIIAPPGRYYRNARYLVVAIAFGCGLWFAYDGWIGWPGYRDWFNSQPLEKRVTLEKPKPDFDIKLQRYISVTLLVAAPLMLGFFLYRSRGSYQLLGQTLHVPGRSPVPFSSIRLIDKTQWDRKGIAYVTYVQDTNGREARLKLDDFVYDQQPTQQIVARIDQYAAEHPDQIEIIACVVNQSPSIDANAHDEAVESDDETSS